MSSYSYVELLRRRARSFLSYAEEALTRRDYDLACFFAEQALQLYLKALILRILGYTPRTHRLTELLGIVTRALRELGRQDLADRISSELRKWRRDIAMLVDAYTGARYLHHAYEKEDAEVCIDIAKRVLGLLQVVEREVFSYGGSGD